MAHMHPCAPSPAPSPSTHSNRLAVQLECDRGRLCQRAIDGLSDALHVLQGNPTSVTELQHALGRSMRAVTALKRLAALGCSAPPTQSPAKAHDAPALQATVLTKKRRRRRYFDAHYKRQVVQLMREKHLTVGQVCKDLNLVDSAVRRWLLEFGTPQACPPGPDSTASIAIAPVLSDAEQRICALEHRLQQLQSDNELLKKTSALFAREIYRSSVPGR